MSIDILISFLVGCFFFIQPLLFIFPSVTGYENPKYMALITIALLCGVLIFIRVIREKEALQLDRRVILLLLFLGFTFCVDIVGVDPKVSLLGSEFRQQGFITLLSFSTLFLAAYVIKTSYSFMYKAVIVSTVLATCILIWQQIAVTQGYFIPTFNGRIFGTFGNPNFVSGYIAMGIPFFLLIKNKTIRVLSIIFCFVGVVLPWSRSGLLAFSAVVFFYLLWMYKAIQWRMGIIVIAMLGIYFCYPYFTQTTSIWDNRPLIWEKGIAAVIERPLFGYGQENFELAFPANLHMKVDNAHNIFLEVLISSGFIGLGLFIALVAVSFQKIGMYARLAIVAFLVSAFFNPVSLAQLSLFWFLLGSRKNSVS